MEEGIIQYEGTYYKVSQGKVWNRDGILRAWKPIPKDKSNKILKEIKRMKSDPATLIYNKK
jgi:hypothetical protein